MSSNNTTLTTTSPQQTADIGKAIGQSIQPATLVGLVGSLGAGKTNLTQGIGSGIGAHGSDVVSPTFTICVPHVGRVKMLHLDAYRIKDGSEVDELALDEELEDGAVVLVEWADLIQEYLPEMDLVITLQADSEHQRRLQMEAQTNAGEALIQAVTASLGSNEA